MRVPMTENESVQLINRWQAGDEQAAEAIFERYVSRLIVLARSRMGPQLQRRIDPEDVLPSAYIVGRSVQLDEEIGWQA